MAGTKPTGQTRDAGFQIGVRRTLPIDPADAWRFLTSAAGVRLWLGAGPELRFAPGAAYQRDDGARGEVRVFRPGQHLRLTWQPPEWQHPSTIQLRVLASRTGATVAFHQEWLPGPAEREQRRAHFAGVLDAIERGVAAELAE
ncbi:MAG TPA: SRPBCC domain-containing protein [Kouleothrix sp.]|uniref:SRPBCC family protein n=1 Tax=Kouleothrix sp. TaxID=2779161 RepID=UPI002C22A69F|nr:SRPBCC domain-containing protein [Kouleothrix sp.]